VTNLDGAQQVHIGRQAIYDAAGDVLAYELLFRDRADASTATTRGSYATARVLTAAWAGFGLDELVGNRAVFVNLTREFITGDLPLPVSPAQVGVEIPHDVEVDRALVAGVASLAERGFTVVLDNFAPGTSRARLLPFVTYVKVDHLNADPQAVERAVDEVGTTPHVQLIAYRLEDPAAVAGAMERGFQLFQGNALGHPYVMTTASDVQDPAAVGAVIAELDSGAPDPVRVTELINRSPALAAGVRRILGAQPGGPPLSLTPADVAEFREWTRLLRFMAAVEPVDVPARHRLRGLVHSGPASPA
jgi:c-di-GMP-related signal transduction protein